MNTAVKVNPADRGATSRFARPAFNFVLFIAVTAGITAAADLQPHYVEESWYADSYCSDTYCTSSTPFKVSGSMSIGASVAGRHDASPLQNHRIRLETFSTAWIRILGQKALLTDFYTAVSGSPLQSHAIVRLFIHGQEVDFQEESGQSAFTPYYVIDFLDSTIINPDPSHSVRLIPRVTVAYEDFTVPQTGDTFGVYYGVTGSIVFNGEVRADAATVRAEGGPDFNLRTSASAVTVLPPWAPLVVANGLVANLPVTVAHPMGTAKAFELSSDQFRASIERHQSVSGDTNYTYSVDYQNACISLLPHELTSYVHEFYYPFPAPSFGGPPISGEPTLLDPYGVDELCGDFLDESGFHNSGTPTIGVAPREPTAGRDDPAFTAWSELLAAVGATDPADAKAVTTLVPRMTAWFRTAPFRPADIIASLYALDGKRGAVLLEGLSGAARIEAEEVLRQVAGSQTVNVLARKAAVRALARRPWSSRSAEALYQLAETGQRDLSHAAWLALGTAANRLSMTAEADRIRERLIQAFTRATAAADRKILIAALGNTGADAALSVIEPAIAHPDPGVRAVAVSALRLVASSRADTLIRDRLTKDPDLSVRKWALMATAYRDPRLHRDAVKSIVESHPAEELRGRAVRLATDWSHAGMDVRDILAAAGR